MVQSNKNFTILISQTSSFIPKNDWFIAGVESLESLNPTPQRLLNKIFSPPF